ncbi:MAG: fibronectin/fibrinogen-binding protein, partial [Lachnospiraceae bacterium]|nr:fibronectin/fibrinogen-binding protein [Lachnospiraceae bacterium]
TYADKNDTWFHIKNDTGSHVILKADYNTCDIKDIEDAASIAAYFSSKKDEKKVEVDYTLVKELKKVKGKAPGFCIYHKNYSITIVPKKPT